MASDPWSESHNSRCTHKSWPPQPHPHLQRKDVCALDFRRQDMYGNVGFKHHPTPPFPTPPTHPDDTPDPPPSKEKQRDTGEWGVQLGSKKTPEVETYIHVSGPLLLARSPAPSGRKRSVCVPALLPHLKNGSHLIDSQWHLEPTIDSNRHPRENSWRLGSIATQSGRLN